MKNKKDYLIKTLAIQSAICCVLFCVFFALKQNNSESFNEIKSFANKKFNDNITFEEAMEVFSSIKEKTSTQTTGEAIVNGEKTEEETVFVPFEEPSLSAEIRAEGGADIFVNSEDEIPGNVSLSAYKLNRKMNKPVLSNNITSRFGTRIHPISGDLRFHAGIDIAADTGTPIYAAFDGTVLVADYDQWNGNYIKLIHDNGIMTVYCHCEELFVEKGHVIRGGEVIATIGSTGSSTGPHLHFEFRVNNISYNPESAFKEATNAI